MDPSCQLPSSTSIFQSVVAGTDCAITERASQAYATLQAPGSGFAQITTVLLTIYVAIIGYRLILGYASLSLAELIPHFIKIGIVLALVSNWSAYQPLVFNLLFHAPEELATTVTASRTSNGNGQTAVLEGLQDSYDRLTAVAALTWSRPAAEDFRPPAPGERIAASAPKVAPVSPRPSIANQLGASQFTSLLLWFSAFVMVAASVGALLVLRIVLALLLLVGPFFILTGLFAGTRGLLEGWLRVAVRYAIAPLFVTLGSAGLVVVLAPFITQLEQTPEQPEPSTALAIALIIAVFAAVLIQASKLSGGIARGIRLPRGKIASTAEPQGSRPPVAGREGTFRDLTNRAETRAYAVTRNMAPTPSRDRAIVMFPASDNRQIAAGSAVGSVAVDIRSRLGQTYRRAAVVQQPLSRS